MADKLVSVNDDYDFPAPVAARVAQKVAAQVEGVKALAVSGQFELQPLWVTGHSWFGNNSNATPNARFFERVAKRFGMGIITNRGVSGRTSGDIANLTLSGTNAWVPRTKALAVMMCTINDVTLFDGSAESRRGYNHAWRSMLSAITANAAVASNTKSFAYSPGWTAAAVTGAADSPQGATKNSTGGTQWTTTTTGSYFEFTFTGTQVDVFMVAKATGAGVVTFTEGATTLGTLDLTTPVAQDVPAVFKIRGRAAGAHTIRGTLTSGASATVDSYRIPLAAPAPILVLGEPAVIPTSTDQPTYLADVEAFKQDLAQIVDEFPSARYLDLNSKSGWDAASMLTTDGKHPQDWGSAWIADRVQEELHTFPYSVGLNTLAPNFPSAYTAPAGPAIPSGGFDGTGPKTVVSVTDDFNVADRNVVGKTTTTGGLIWAGSGDLKVAAGEARLTAGATTFAERVAIVDTSRADGTLTATLSALQIGAPARTGLLARYQGGNDYISARAYHKEGAGPHYYAIWKAVAGEYTPIGVSSVTPAVGDVMELRFSGASLELFINGVRAATASETMHSANTKHGLVVNYLDAVSAVDNFSFAG